MDMLGTTLFKWNDDIAQFGEDISKVTTEKHDISNLESSKNLWFLPAIFNNHVLRISLCARHWKSLQVPTRRLVLSSQQPEDNKRDETETSCYFGPEPFTVVSILTESEVVNLENSGALWKENNLLAECAS